MNSFMRRLIHMEFAKPEYNDIATDSFGEGEGRRLRIIWKGEGNSTDIE